MARRTERQAQQTKADIIKAARQCFVEEGYEASLSKIVGLAGTSKGALFHHFKNKKALFREVWTELNTRMNHEAQQAAKAARSETDPYAAFLAGCRTYLQWVTREDYQKIVLIDGPAVLGPITWHESGYTLGQYSIRIGLEYLAGQRLLEPAQVPVLTVLLHSALDGAGFVLSRKDPDVTPESLLSAFESLLRGLAHEISSGDPHAPELTD